MTLERKTTALEFETMLRRHLRRGGAPVSACAGFDPDRASAYLEGGLGDNARGRYEAHLAGCPACRRHIIELSRLAQLTLQPEAMPVPARWPRWRSYLAEKLAEKTGHWVDPSSWRLNWRLAGTVLSGCAILAFAMITRPGRQLSFTNNEISIATPRQDANPSAAVQAPSPAPPVGNGEFNGAFMDAQSSPPAPGVAQSSAGNAQAGDAQTDRVSALSRLKPVIPKPVISANEILSDAAQVRAAESSERLSGALEDLSAIAKNDRVVRGKEEHNLTSDLVPASPPPTVARRRARQGVVAEFIPSKRQDASGPESEIIVAKRNRVEDDQLSSSMPLPRMTPNPEYNPMQSGLRAREMPKAKDEKGSLQNQKTSFWAYFTPIVDYMKGYWPLRRPGGFERSLIVGKDAERDSDNAANENNKNNKNEDSAVGKGDKSLIRHLRGKTFRYVRGVWIDDQYDAEMSAWRLTWLRRGSEAYNRVLAEEPQLKEFFDFGQIIIVWQDKIYRVQGNK
jgi:hypothetical protein